MIRITLFSAFFLFISFSASAQDWSDLGNKLNYSDTLKNATVYRDIDKALAEPSKVIALIMNVDKDGANYKKFAEHRNEFSNLRKLVLHNAWVQADVTLLSDFSVFPKLEFLSLDFFRHADPKGLETLHDLKYLAIEGADFTVVPATMLTLTKLEVLNLSLNKLSTLPENIGDLSNLRELELTNNCFDSIPPQIAQLKTLEYLTFNNAETPRSDFSYTFSDGTPYCRIKLDRFPTALASLPKLKKVSFFKVDISDAMWKQLKTTYPNVKHWK